MADPLFANEEQVAERRTTAWAEFAEEDKRLSVHCYRKEHRWLHERVEELEGQLWLRTIVLAGALALNVFLGGFIATPFDGRPLPTVELAVTPSSATPGNSQPVTCMEWPSHIEQSEVWAMGEKQIEAIAALHFDAQRRQALTEPLRRARPEAKWLEAMKPELSAKDTIRGGEREAGSRNWSPPSPKTVLTYSFSHDRSRSAGASKRSHYVAKDFVNLRAAPNNSAEVLAVVAQGELVRRTGHNLGWLQVEYDDRSASSIRGWVYGSYLRVVDTAGESAQP
jgi:Bacterial SH3 domain